MARVDRRRGHHPRGRRRPHRPGAPRAGAPPPRRPAAAHRVVLGGLQRHRHPVGHARHLRPAAPARRAVVLGLRGRRARTWTSRCRRGGRRPMAMRPTPSSTPRTPSSSRPTSSSAVPARRGCWWRAASCSATACPPSWVAARSRTSTQTSTSTWPTPSSARRRAPPPSSSRSVPGSCSSSRTSVGVDAIREREESFIARAMARWERVPGLELLGDRRAERLSIVSFVVRHAAATCITTRRGAAQRPVRHPGARRLLLRGALRPPPPGHRHRRFPRVRA